MPSVALSALNLQSYSLFDKVIRVYFYHSDGVTYDLLDCPAPGQGKVQVGQGASGSIQVNNTGRKPTIRLKGTLVGDPTQIHQSDLRITNLYVPQPLNTYKSIRVEAGYRGAMKAAFKAGVHLAYQELPGPDAVTLFQVMIGDLGVWRNTFFSGSYLPGVLLHTSTGSGVLDDIANKMGLTLEYSASPSLSVKQPGLFLSGLLKDLFPKIKKMFESYSSIGTKTGIELYLYGDKLICYTSNTGRTAIPITVLDFISHAKHSSAGYEIQAPWIPGLTPGQLVYIDPRYFRQDFGGDLVAVPGNVYIIYRIDFDFCTTDSTNTMTLLTLGAEGDV